MSHQHCSAGDDRENEQVVQPSERLRKALHGGKWLVSNTKEGIVNLWYDAADTTYFLNRTTPFVGGASTEAFEAATVEEAAALFVLLCSTAR